jgi:hypothetical protein
MLRSIPQTFDCARRVLLKLQPALPGSTHLFKHESQSIISDSKNFAEIFFSKKSREIFFFWLLLTYAVQSQILPPHQMLPPAVLGASNLGFLRLHDSLGRKITYSLARNAYKITYHMFKYLVNM